MRRITTTLIAGTALASAGAALADDHVEAPSNTYIISGTMSDTNLVGGLGGEDEPYLSASWSETLTITGPDGTVRAELTSTCVGMGQPSGDLFDRHVSCTHDNGKGSTGGVIMGCSNDGGGEMTCMGRFVGKTGTVEGDGAMQVVHYQWTSDDGGKVNGSGYWLGGGDDEEEGEGE
ncbi:MAG: hypothetical protein HKP43_00360 [Altererythrobacter sp.]|nr:hypothetical protein [Altererythrobacter sp.]NNK45064.1 hypothetical protein [Altererythrobacter sp.]